MSTIYQQASSTEGIAKLVAGGIAVLCIVTLYYAWFGNQDFLQGRLGITFKVGIAQSIGIIGSVGLVSYLIWKGAALRQIAVVGLIGMLIFFNGILYTKKGSGTINGNVYPRFDSTLPVSKGMRLADLMPSTDWAEKQHAKLNVHEQQSTGKWVFNKEKAAKFKAIALRAGYKLTGAKLTPDGQKWCQTHHGDNDKAQYNCYTFLIWTK